MQIALLRLLSSLVHWTATSVVVAAKQRSHEMAQAAGHRTLAGHGHGYFLKDVGGLHQGFDDYRLLPGTLADQAPARAPS